MSNMFCRIFGHKMYGDDGISGAHKCIRKKCGNETPAIDWGHGPRRITENHLYHHV